MDEESSELTESTETDNPKTEDDIEDILEAQFAEEGEEQDEFLDYYQNVGINTDEDVTTEVIDLLNRNTPSFRCLAQLNISRSSILRHPLYPFPPLEDPGLDAALEYEEPPQAEMDRAGCITYKLKCKALSIVPISRVLKSLTTSVLDLMYYGLSEIQVYAIMEALKVNDSVQDIILQDNWLTPTAVQHLSDMLQKNKKIRLLNLRECRLQPEGALNLGPALIGLTALKELDLSFNALDSRGLRNLEAGLIGNNSIVKLNLSNNNFGEDAAESLAAIINKSNSYVDLDISWNRFFTPTNKALFIALSKNHSIQNLNVSWNGIGTAAAAAPILRYLRKTDALLHLDLTNNRLTGNALRPVRLGLSKCKTINSVKIGNNPIDPLEAIALINIFKKPISLEILDMENIFVTKTFVPLWEKYRQEKKTIIIGGVLSNYQIFGPDLTNLLFRRARFSAMNVKSKKAQKDFGHFILKLPEENVTVAEFIALAEPFKMKKVDPDLLKAIAEKFFKKEKVNLVSLRDTYMRYYPETELPPPKPKKEKPPKKGKDKKGKSSGADGQQSEVLQTEYEGSEEGELEEEEGEEGEEEEEEEYGQEQMLELNEPVLNEVQEAPVEE